MTTTDLGAFLGLVTGYQGAAVVTAASRLGVFERLARQPWRGDDLAAELGTDPHATGALLASLEALGLAARGPAGFTATPFVVDRLGRDAELGLVVEKEAFFARAWLDLERVVRTGRPVLDPWRERLDRDPDQARAFLQALDVLARLTGPDLASVPALTPGRTVIDVGGGLGSYARMLAAAGSDVVLLDLPQVAAWAREALADVEACRVVAADVVSEPLPAEAAGADAALVSHLLHDLSPETCVEVLAAVRASLAPGGAVVVNDFARDAGPGPFGPLFDLMMCVETGGAAYEVAELVVFCEEAGFVDVRRLDVPAPLTLLEARIPSA